MSLARANSSTDASPALASSPKRSAEAERRAHIVAAAERAFVRFGFHAATMQHVAEEAGMSAGNLYRYFPSKEAIVEDLCAADQVERADIFAQITVGGDLLTSMAAVLREHLLTRPPEKARMIVEIWAEAGRNPRVAALTRALDEDVLAGIERLMDVAKASGAAAPTLDTPFAARVIFTLVAGLFKRLALEPAFDPQAEAAMAIGVFRALFAGALAPAAVKEI
jgi:TetR/AcrR family transcriptional regulator, repressor for uid operon